VKSSEKKPADDEIAKIASLARRLREEIAQRAV
jgi:hypothetical protein